ncbi:hypothetical protein VK94_12055 [Bacillus sp. LK7]|nr:hypothetical protein AAV29_19830 [Bacillus velezensis]KMN55643.1 hypothetical protein VK94_12055 [Bacillus sp. LK7]MBR8695235.1 hypothetical protein [Bacillus velezensis]PAE76784.1 hypothetical protein CHH82_09580 [Bacillus velezensis]
MVKVNVKTEPSANKLPAVSSAAIQQHQSVSITKFCCDPRSVLFMASEKRHKKSAPEKGRLICHVSFS